MSTFRKLPQGRQPGMAGAMISTKHGEDRAPYNRWGPMPKTDSEDRGVGLRQFDSAGQKMVGDARKTGSFMSSKMKSPVTARKNMTNITTRYM